jgi:hypothetical protein
MFKGGLAVTKRKDTRSLPHVAGRSLTPRGMHRVAVGTRRGSIAMQRRRPTGRAKVSVTQAFGHFAMGASLGTAGALILLIDNIAPIHGLAADSAPSGLPVALFVGACAFAIAVGATLTGIAMSAVDAD